jgi:hypothetical protein
MAYDDFMKFVPRDERGLARKGSECGEGSGSAFASRTVPEAKETERLVSPGRQLESNGGSDPARVCAVMRDNY